MNVGTTQMPDVIGAAVSVADSTSLANLDVSGLTVGTTAYNVKLSAAFTLTISTAALVTDSVVAVAGYTGYRWIIGGSASGFGTPGVINSNLPSAGTSPATLHADGLPGQNLVALWTIGAATRRIYLVDGVNGNDSNPGFLDGGASNFPISPATIAATAKKTIGALDLIFPRYGNGRSVEVIIASGTYTDSLNNVLQGYTGYANGFPIIRGTATSTTAGCTAFDGTTADNIFVGAITVAGLNAGGYNITGTPTSTGASTHLAIQLAGGGASALPAEPAAPLGWRIRFDAATTTAALRNVTAQIAKVSSSSTIEVLSEGSASLPALPVAADIFYIERAGVILSSTAIIQMGGTACIGNGGTGSARNAQCVGLQFTSIAFYGIGIFFAFCGITGSSAFGGCTTAVAQTVLTADHGTLNVGGGLVTTGSSTFTGGWVTTHGFVVVGAIAFRCMSLTNWRIGGYASAGMTVDGGTGNTTAGVYIIGSEGTDAGGQEYECRIAGPTTGGGLRLLNATVCLGSIIFSNVTGVPCISLGSGVMAYQNYSVSTGSILTGSSGNTGTGLGFAGGAATFVSGSLQAANSVTGSVGDIALNGGQIVSWANTRIAGIVDEIGNRIITQLTATTGVGPTASLKFLATLTSSSGGASFTYAT